MTRSPDGLLALQTRPLVCSMNNSLDPPGAKIRGAASESFSESFMEQGTGLASALNWRSYPPI